MPRRSRRPWFSLLLLTGCADYERPARACDRLGALCIAEDAVVGLDLTRSKGATGDLDGDDVRDLVSAADHGLSITYGRSGVRAYRLIPGGVAGARLGDVDGDGDLDVVFATREPASLRVLENRGGRELVDGPTLALAGRAASLWLGELDGDDSLDAVVGGTGGLAVVTRGLTRLTTIAAGRDLAAVEAGDLDGDGRLDIVAADRGDAAVQVALAQGDGFATPRRITSGAAPEHLQLYDLDGDDRLDILTHGDGRQIWWHAGEGAGAFASPRGLVVQDDASPGFGAHRDEQGRRWLLTIDDGHAIASMLDDTDKVVRRIAAGARDAAGLDMDAGAPLVHGSWLGERYLLAASHLFTELWHSGTGGTFGPLVLADVDQDGELDLIAAEHDLVVRRRLADGTWGEPWTLPTSHYVTTLAVADATGDGLPDLVIGDGAPSVRVAVGVGDGTFTDTTPTPLASEPELLHVGLAGPGEPAAVATAGGDALGVAVHQFDGAGALSGQTGPIGSGHVVALDGADLDADGVEDLVALVNDASGTSLVLVPRIADGWGPTRTRLLADVHPADAPPGPLDEPKLALADIDLDARVDAVIVTPQMIARLPDIAAETPPPSRVDEQLWLGYLEAIALADADGDARPDIVTCSSSELRIALVADDGELQPQVPLKGSTYACALHVDPDGQATAALVSNRGYALLRPDLAPALALTDLFEGGPGELHRFATGDLDADGHTDIVVADRPEGLEGSVAVLWGQADGRPRDATRHAARLNARAELAVAPLDDRPGDDLVIAWEAGDAEIWTHSDGALQLFSDARPGFGYGVEGVGVQARGDGRSDVVVLRRSADTLDLIALPRDADGRFVAQAEVLLWSLRNVLPGAAMTIADLDRDGFDDVAVLPGTMPYTIWNVVVVWGDAARSGELTQFTPSLPNVRNIGAADLDGDGAPELIFGGSHGVFSTKFGGRNALQMGFQVMGAAETLLTADLEADGRADFLRTSGDSLDVVLRSAGDDAVAQLALGGPWTHLRAAHLDGDEILDLLGLQGGKLVTRLSGSTTASATDDDGE